MILFFAIFVSILSFFYFNRLFPPFNIILVYLFISCSFSLYYCLGPIPDQVYKLNYQLTLTDCYLPNIYIVEFLKHLGVLYLISFLFSIFNRLFPSRIDHKPFHTFSTLHAKSIPFFSITRSSLVFQSSIFMILCFHFLSSFFGPNLWYNEEYLLLQKASSYAFLPSLAVIVVRISPLLSIYLAVFLGLSSIRKVGFPCFFLAWVNLLYVFIFIQVSGNSRYSLVTLAIIGFFWSRSKKLLPKLAGFLSLMFIPFAFIRTFLGRHGPQGLSQFFDYFRVFNNFDKLQDYFDSFQFLLLSLFNSNYLGVIASDRGFISSFEINFLTFLPLPSDLIGSDLLNQSLYDNIITRVVPYPGASQLINSGYIMFSFGIIYYTIMFFLTHKVKQIYSNTLPYFFVFSISVLSFIISYQYPLRLTSRLSWMSIASSTLLILFRNRFLSSRRPEY